MKKPRKNGGDKTHTRKQEKIDNEHKKYGAVKQKVGMDGKLYAVDSRTLGGPGPDTRFPQSNKSGTATSKEFADAGEVYKWMRTQPQYKGLDDNALRLLAYDEVSQKAGKSPQEQWQDAYDKAAEIVGKDPRIRGTEKTAQAIDGLMRIREEARQKHFGSSGKNRGMAGASPPPVKISSPEEVEKLAPGTLFMTPDGRTMRK